MRRSGYADLPLHGGRVPEWLAERMAKLGGAIAETIIFEYGRSEFLTRLSDPFWFQAFGAVLGMDWHSSGITTSVMGALKRAMNFRAHELGIHICGGRGRHSRKTPEELRRIADQRGLAGDSLVRASRLTARVDNNAVQDGFQIYLHSFVVTDDGEWAVVQQGMRPESGTARRYHWHSPTVRSFTEEPHKGIVGESQGLILNLVDQRARAAQDHIRALAQEPPERVLAQARRLVMPRRHAVREHDVDLKRLGAVLALAYDRELKDFADVLLLEGLGPRTLQSLALVTEVIHGTPARFADPARFSFAHGGKDRRPFPVPLKAYDETIGVLSGAMERARLGDKDKSEGLKRLGRFQRFVEHEFAPQASFAAVIEKEFGESPGQNGRSVFGTERELQQKPKQLKLF